MTETPENSKQIPEPELSVIVVTYGAREMTLACLRSLVAEAGSLRSEIIVVDNNSPGTLAADISRLFPETRVLVQHANLGFAAAANLGADTARGRYLLFLNPDTLLPAGTLVPLLERVRRDPGAGLWGVRTCFPDGQLNPTSCRRRPTLWRLLCSGVGLDTAFPEWPAFSGMSYANLGQTGERTVDIICGVCLLVARGAWDRLAGFSPAFFMYGEDDDFSLRATRVGYTPTVLLDFSIVHHGSGTEQDQQRKLCQILAARSLVLRAHFTGPARQAGRLLLLLRPFLGTHFAERKLRPLWQAVWLRRRHWLSGRFA